MSRKKKENPMPFPIPLVSRAWHWFCVQVDKHHSLRKTIQAAILVGISAFATSMLNDPTFMENENVWYMAILIALLRGAYNHIKHRGDEKE